MAEKSNHPILIWSICFLWLLSLIGIAWSLLLIFCVGNILFITRTDNINAIILISAFAMVPANMILMCAVANGRVIDWNYKILSCPLWVCNIIIIIINAIGAILCIIKIHSIHNILAGVIKSSLRQYRHVPKYKHFIDNLQWTLKCCGLNTYKDWFDYDWYDKSQEMEWKPSNTKINKRESVQHDSVPLSCCKSGSCLSNYLSELGTYSINTEGCLNVANKLILWTLIANLIIFLLTIFFEIMILIQIRKKRGKGIAEENEDDKYHVRHIMSINEKFEEASSDYFEKYPSDEGSDEIERSEEHIRQ